MSKKTLPSKNIQTEQNPRSCDSEFRIFFLNHKFWALVFAFQNQSLKTWPDLFNITGAKEVKHKKKYLAYLLMWSINRVHSTFLYDIAYVNFGWCKALHQAFTFWVANFTANGYREIQTSYRLINRYSIISYLSHNIMPNFLEFTSLEHKFPQMLVKMCSTQDFAVFNTKSQSYIKGRYALTALYVCFCYC